METVRSDAKSQLAEVHQGLQSSMADTTRRMAEQHKERQAENDMHVATVKRQRDSLQVAADSLKQDNSDLQLKLSEAKRECERISVDVRPL